MVAHKLAALVSLVFAVSHCAIDDRDLEEHDGDDDDSGGSSNGGSSNGGTSNGGTSTGGTATGGTGGSAGLPIDCQRDGDDDDCYACEKAACCDEYLACDASLDCALYVYCGAACGSDTACILECGRSYPEGEALFGDFIECGDASCGDIC